MFGAIDDAAHRGGVFAQNGLFPSCQIDPISVYLVIRYPARKHVVDATTHLLTWWSMPAVNASFSSAPKQTSSTGARCSKDPRSFASSPPVATS